MLGEFLVCPVEAIDEALLASGSAGRWPCFEVSGLTPVNIAKLGSILEAGTYDEMLAQAVADHRESASGASGVFTVPPVVLTALEECDDLDAIASRWAATGELAASRWQAADATRVLGQLAGLAGGRRDPVWYWWSV